MNRYKWTGIILGIGIFVLIPAALVAKWLGVWPW